MDALKIEGNGPLKGSIHVSGSKNAALPLMCCSLLSDQSLQLSNVPHLADIHTMQRLLHDMGVEISHHDDLMTMRCHHLKTAEAPYDHVRKMRASILVLGPLLTRHGRAKVSLPGGCAIGTRPVDLHLSAMEKLGAHIELRDGYVEASASKGLTGSKIVFPKISVGATENAMMAATLAKGKTTLINAAREPEIIDLAQCLRSMGAIITGDGTDQIIIEGVDNLKGTTHSVVSDRIEAGTFILSAVATRGIVSIHGARAEHLTALIEKLERMGVNLSLQENQIIVDAETCGPLTPVDVDTQPYPGFPTDLQAQMMAVLAQCPGDALLTENIFENRFMHVPELIRMGANVTLKGPHARVRGQAQLKGAPVMATDLRASVSLVMAALAAEGTTIVKRVYHLDRGYEKLEEKLSACGAKIERIKDS